MTGVDERLAYQFQAELAALDQFRVGYAGGRPNLPLRGDDPDVQRMIEALAFFSARTRLASERAVDESLLRIFRQHFPYLLSPIPALTMLSMIPHRSLTEPVHIAAGTAVEIRSQQTPEQKFSFKTLEPLTLLPVWIDSVVLRKQGTASAPRGMQHGASALRAGAASPALPTRRLELSFTSAFPRSAQFDSLALQVDYLGDVGASMLVYSELRRHVQSANIVWVTVDTQFGAELSQPLPCSLRFRSPTNLTTPVGALEHPVQRIRAALHHPQQALTLHITDLAPPANWRSFMVAIELGSDWPDALPLPREVFKLHCVPIVNVERTLSEVIVHDGTRDRHRLSYPAQGTERFVPVTVHGAFRVQKSGLVPLVPSVLAPLADSYEAHAEGTGSDRRAYVTLHMEHAFEQAPSVVVDASWHQPEVALTPVAELKARFATKSVPADLRLEHALAPALETALGSDRATLLELLAVKGHRLLELAALRVLLRTMSLTETALFSNVSEALCDVRVREKPSGKRQRSLKYLYELEFGPVTASDFPKVELLCEQLFDLLRVWSGSEIIEMTAHIPNLQRTLTLRANETQRP
ncbi:MAG: hypothetical protein JWN04_6615 [Myxococcaceae bacterium]|nr:hypothetical protein [Myxococcaceae bacterium]